MSLITDWKRVRGAHKFTCICHQMEMRINQTLLLSRRFPMDGFFLGLGVVQPQNFSPSYNCCWSFLNFWTQNTRNVALQNHIRTECLQYLQMFPHWEKELVSQGRVRFLWQLQSLGFHEVWGPTLLPIIRLFFSWQNHWISCQRTSLF